MAAPSVIPPDVSSAPADGLLRLHPIQAWVWLLALGAAALAVVLWAMFGRITETIAGDARLEGQRAVIWLPAAQASAAQPGQLVRFACPTPLDGIVEAVDGQAVVAVLQQALDTPLACPAEIRIGETRPIQRFLP